MSDPAIAESSPASIEAAARRGSLVAKDTLQHLASIGIKPLTTKCGTALLPGDPEVIMEISAARQLGDWLESGLCDYFPEETDAAFAAMEDSFKRLDENPRAFAGLEGLPPLMEKVFAIWEAYFAWSGLEDLKADVLLQAPETDEELLLHELADWLFEHRHLLTNEPGR